MRLLSVIGALIVALWAVGAGWAAIRAAWAAPGAGALAAVAAYAAIFLAAFLYLGFWIYAADRAAGKVQRRIALYERWLSRREPTR